jgi:hypothetical protein
MNSKIGNVAMKETSVKLAASINGVCDTTGVCCFAVVNRIDQAVRAATS